MREKREGDDVLEPESTPGPDDVWSEDDPPQRGPDGIEGEEHLGLTPPG
jgi:hypothetical protein